MKRINKTVCRALVLLVSAALLVPALAACGNGTLTVMTAEKYLAAINEYCADDFGALTVTEYLDAVTSATKITDRLYLTTEADSVTGAVLQAELALYRTPDTTKLEESEFSYFFLFMLKATDPDMSILNINTVRDTLGIGEIVSGTDTSIGYGKNSFYYTVDDDTALFTVVMK